MGAAPEVLRVTDLSLLEKGNAVLQNLSFGQRRGQKLALAGESGAGKSTLLQVVAGLIQPTTGQVLAAGRRVRGPAETLVPGHPGVAYLAQQPSLPRSLRVEQVLRYANQRPATEAQALYELCRIGHLTGRRTDQLSGGEQQRVALARLLLGAPELLLLDEPFSNLDRAHKRGLQGIIEEVGARLGITCLLVSHDAADTLGWADHILVLRQGQLVQHGPPEQVYRQPVDEYTAGLFGDYSLVRGADGRMLAPDAVSTAGGTLLLRPEAFRLGPVRRGSKLVGTVRAVRFLGSYYEVEVALPASLIRASAARVELSVGAQVAVSVVAGSGHLISSWPAPAC